MSVKWYCLCLSVPHIAAVTTRFFYVLGLLLVLKILNLDEFSVVIPFMFS